ncbi:hypothetical protein JNW90_21180 [Micromonospora sp. STR1s_5]|nr:hypothetical protein [Micromonospora sp. STR1s_5]
MADRRPDPELVAEVVLRLLRVRRRLGLAAFQEAADRALVGIGVAAHHEAERRAKKLTKRRRPPNPSTSATVLRFPLPRAIHGQADDEA